MHSPAQYAQNWCVKVGGEGFRRTYQYVMIHTNTYIIHVNEYTIHTKTYEYI